MPCITKSYLLLSSLPPELCISDALWRERGEPPRSRACRSQIGADATIDIIYLNLPILLLAL